MGVGYDAAWQENIPLGAELHMIKHRRCKVVDVVYSPARYLIQYYVWKVCSMA